MVSRTALLKMKLCILKLGIRLQKPGSGEPAKEIGAKTIETAIGAWYQVESAHQVKRTCQRFGCGNSGIIGVRDSHCNFDNSASSRERHASVLSYR